MFGASVVRHASFAAHVRVYMVESTWLTHGLFTIGWNPLTSSKYLQMISFGTDSLTFGKCLLVSMGIYAWACLYVLPQPPAHEMTRRCQLHRKHATHIPSTGRGSSPRPPETGQAVTSAQCQPEMAGSHSFSLIIAVHGVADLWHRISHKPGWLTHRLRTRRCNTMGNIPHKYWMDIEWHK